MILEQKPHFLREGNRMFSRFPAVAWHTEQLDVASAVGTALSQGHNVVYLVTAPYGYSAYCALVALKPEDGGEILCGKGVCGFLDFASNLCCASPCSNLSLVVLFVDSDAFLYSLPVLVIPFSSLDPQSFNILPVVSFCGCAILFSMCFSVYCPSGIHGFFVLQIPRGIVCLLAEAPSLLASIFLVFGHASGCSAL